MPAVSVILPVRSQAARLERSIASILRQTLTDWELLIVANGSDEATLAIVHSQTDARVRTFELGVPNVSVAFNYGLARARSPIVARMDADDFAHRRRLELQVKFLEAHADVSVVASRVRFTSRLERCAGFRRYVRWQNSLVTPEEIRGQRFVESPLVNPTICARRGVLEELGGYRTGDFPEDYDLWLRAFSASHTIAKLPRALLVWQDHFDRLTRRDSRYSERAFHQTKVPHLARELEARRVGRTRPLAIWGTGQVARRYARLLLDRGFSPEAYIEIAPKRIGGRRHGVPVLAPEALRNVRGTRPFVLSYVPGWDARRQIEKQLHAWGYQPESDYFLVA